MPAIMWLTDRKENVFWLYNAIAIVVIIGCGLMVLGIETNKKLKQTGGHFFRHCILVSCSRVMFISREQVAQTRSPFLKTARITNAFLVLPIIGMSMMNNKKLLIVVVFIQAYSCDFCAALYSCVEILPLGLEVVLRNTTKPWCCRFQCEPGSNW